MGENFIFLAPFLCRVDSDEDYCGQCPNKKKYHILRAMCSHRRPYSHVFKRALINELNSGKDVKSLVPSLKETEKKSRFCNGIPNSVQGNTFYICVRVCLKERLLILK